MNEDKFSSLYEFDISSNLLEGDLVQITYGTQIVAQYIVAQDKSSPTSKLILTPATFPKWDKVKVQ